VAVDPSATAVRVVRPDGRVEAAQIQDGQAIYAGAGMPGPYLVEQVRGDQVIEQRRFAVNLFDPDESNIAPAERVARVAGERFCSRQSPVNRSGARRSGAGWLPQHCWSSVVEWLVYQRNSLAYLRQRFRHMLAARRQSA
jgi:Ca-activated chloride channel family protein